MVHIALLLTATTLCSASPLYKRQNGVYPEPGTVGPAPLQAWIDSYDAAKAAGRLVDIGPALAGDGGAPFYGERVDTGEGGVCSWSAVGCFADDDLHDAPDGRWGLSFDDGPTAASSALYTFLESMNQSATHYFIGGNCVNNQELVTQAVDSGGHLAIHTWSHPYMTTLTDYQVLGELGWTAQIIYDLSGMIPAYWRPPYGDVDNRVRAIAKEVFGLSTTIWNADTDDWCLSEGGGSSCSGEGPADDAALDALMQGFASGPKSPGLMVLEHELSTRAVGGFTRNYAAMLSSGWEVLPIPDLWNFAWYLNSPSASGPVDASVRVGTGGGGPVVVSTIGAASPSLTEPSSISQEALPSATTLATPVSFDSALGHPAAAAATGATSGAGASFNAAKLNLAALMVMAAVGILGGA